MTIWTWFKLLIILVFVGFIAATLKTKFDYFEQTAATAITVPIASCTGVRPTVAEHVRITHFSSWEGTHAWTNGREAYIFFRVPHAMLGLPLKLDVEIPAVVADAVQFSTWGMSSSSHGTHVKPGFNGALTMDVQAPDGQGNPLVAVVLKVDGARRTSIKDKRWLGAAVSSITICPSRSR